MNAGAIGQRHGNRRCPVIESGSSVSTGHKAWVACCVTPAARLTENSLELPRIAREPILRVVGFPESPQDLFPLLVWAVREIGASDTRHQPSYPHADGWRQRPCRENEGTVRPGRLAPLQTIAGRHVQVGRPLDLLAQPNQDGRGRLGDAIVPVALLHHTAESAEAVVAVGQTSRDHAGPPQCSEDAQQAGLWYPRCKVDV